MTMKIIKQSTMTVLDFALIPDHHKQRNTERHAGKLLSSLKDYGDKGRMDEVAVAVYPDGTMEKLNGHTRTHLWVTACDWPAPAVLKVTYYAVRNRQESAQGYDSFDNRATSKDARDDMEGLARASGWMPQSSAFKGGRGANAVKVAWKILHDLANTSVVKIETAHEKLLPVMRLADGVFAGHRMPHGFIIAGAIVSMSFYPKEGADFLFHVMGDRHGHTTDPHIQVQTLWERGKVLGGQNTNVAVLKYLSAFEKFLSGDKIQDLKPVSFAAFRKRAEALAGQQATPEQKYNNGISRFSRLIKA